MLERQRTYRETYRLQQQLSTLANRCRCLQDTEASQKKIIQQLHSNIDDLKFQLKKSQTKIQELSFQQSSRESQLEFVLKRMEEQLDEKSQKYDRLEAKLFPLLDSDAVRLKVLNEVEFPHRLELEEKDAAIQQLKIELFERRRQVQMLKSRLETNRLDHERQIRELKSKHRNEINNALLDLQALESAEYSRKNSQQNEAIIRKDLQYFRSNYFVCEEQLHKAKKQIEAFKKQHNQKLAQLYQQITHLREENRQLKNSFR